MFSKYLYLALFVLMATSCVNIEPKVGAKVTERDIDAVVAVEMRF